MRFGCCAGLDVLEETARAGFDYIELETGDLLPRQCDADFRSVRRSLEAAPIRPEVFRRLIPDYLRLMGEDLDFQQVRRYILTVLERAAAVGGKIVVFDSGHARHIPEGFPPERAFNQIIGFLRMAADYACRFRLAFAIKPLSRQECHLINTLSDAMDLLEEVDHPNLKVVADPCQMALEGEPWDSLKRAKDHLAHIHVADVAGAMPGTDQDMVEFFDVLRSLGYNGRVSVSCRTQDLEERTPQVVSFLNRMRQ